MLTYQNEENSSLKDTPILIMTFIEEMLEDCTYIMEIKYSPNDP